MFEELQARLRRERELLVAPPQDPEQPAHFDECLPSRRLDRAERLAHRGLLALELALGALSLDHDHADGVRHDIVDGLVEHVREAGLPVELRIEGDAAPLPPGVDVSAYRIVQEALTNPLKHAGPARARVVVRYAADELELEISDDGRAGGNGGSGHGLVGMGERVAVVGGVLESGSRADGGFVVRARLPLDSAHA